MYGSIQQHLQKELAEIKDAGLYKKERIITSPQDAVITISTGEEVINFCANNYLGLSSHPDVIQAAKDAMDTHGFGMSSVRFICGTQDIHKSLETKIAEFVTEREKSVAWLRGLNNPKWDNAFQHPKVGPVTAQLILENWLAHDILHTRQILGLTYGYLKANAKSPLDYAGNW